MKRILYTLAFIVFGVIVIVLIISGIKESKRRSQEKPVSIDSIQKQEGIPVTVVKAEKRTIMQTRTFTGTVKGSEQADATSMILEKIEAIHVKLGDQVKKDQLLVTLDRQNPTARYRQVSDAYADAKKELERSKALFDAGAISQQLYDKAVLAEKIARASVDDVTRLLEVRAPIDGTVTDIFFETGQTVSPGVPIIKIARLNQLITEVVVGEKDIPQIAVGQRAIITTSSYPGRIFNGRISSKALSTNPAARNFTIKILFENTNNLLKPGMFTAVDVILNEKLGALVVPVDALVKENGGMFVYVVAPDSTVRKVSVQSGLSDGEWVSITGSVSLNDTVVIEGQNKLKEGVKVTIIS
jgi:RND family efflux transporter MFP subunit